MRQLSPRRNERGAATVVVLMFFIGLIAAAGLGIDTASLTYQRSRIQHGADAGAIAIAYDCVLRKPCDAATANTTATFMANQNLDSDGGTTSIPGGVSLAAGTVLVHIDKTIPTKFFSVLGTSSKPVSSQARATWTGHPVSGPVIPFAISLCEYKKVPIGTSTFLRADVEEGILNGITPGQTSSVYPALAPYMAPACTVPSGVTLPGNPSSITMLSGGLWLSDNGSSTNNGQLIPTAVLDTLNGGADFQMNNPSKFSPLLVPGKTAMMAIYAPTLNYSHAGLHTNAAGTTTDGSVGLEIIGYAPFVVTGCRLDNKPQQAGLCGGAPDPSSIGITGKFTNTVVKDPSFVYGNGGGDFGAYDVKLTQ